MNNLTQTNKRPIIALMYDFDKTLCADYMQNYGFVPSLGMKQEDFWKETNILCVQENMDSTLAYMYKMVLESANRNTPLKREKLVEMGAKIQFYKGLDTWFDRINNFGNSVGADVEHYVISSGLTEIINGTPLSDKFTKIFACEFVYDENGNAVWPKVCVNYTNKTQFVYRINKGVLEISNDTDLNRSMPDDSKRIPFCNMIYIGDGLSDVPCMKMMKAYGGKAIAVYEPANRTPVEELLQKERVDFIYPTDYSPNTGLEVTVKNIIRQMAVTDILAVENHSQKNAL
ncbi:MAG: haloacid dehalogenase-like hydrolase [Oscillospiraceae bacterium]|jgi:2-hydroxy-3-keto-5-methylthiopentenyl-1-phosphate phosphatase|nr:haloacid dehalogenase-like hydrolase [Oscillospiraceae bacterium]